MSKLISIQIGKPQVLPPDPNTPLGTKAWLTGFYKSPIVGGVVVEIDGIVGDGQADLISHGGPDKAICVYPSEHFSDWGNFLEVEDFPNGGFGENFTVAGLLETEVCVGDVYRLGDVVVEVSQPRQPCWKLARRWDCKSLTPEVRRTGRTGWYFRVLQTGEIAAPLDIELVQRGGDGGQWTIELANKIIHQEVEDEKLVEAFASYPPLSESWKKQLQS